MCTKPDDTVCRPTSYREDLDGSKSIDNVMRVSNYY